MQSKTVYNSCSSQCSINLTLTLFLKQITSENNYYIMILKNIHNFLITKTASNSFTKHSCYYYMRQDCIVKTY